MLSRLVSRSGRFCRSFTRTHAPPFHVSQTRSIVDPVIATSLVVQHGIDKATKVAADAGWRAISAKLGAHKKFFSRKAEVVKYFEKMESDGLMSPLLDCREPLRDEFVEHLRDVCALPGHFAMVAGPKNIGKSTMFFSVAKQFAMMDEFAPIWIECDPREKAFANSWKRAFGLSPDVGSDDFVDVANIVLEGREGLKRLISHEEKITEVLSDGELVTGSGHIEVPEDVTTIVFVDQLQSSFGYISALESMVRKHSAHPKITYVLIASDYVDSYRISSRRERRCHTIRMTPFDEEMMSESLMIFLKSQRVNVGHDECVDLAQLLMTYTWETTQAHYFVRRSIDHSAEVPRLDKDRLVEVAEEYIFENAGVLRRSLHWVPYTAYSTVLKLIDDKGRIPIAKYEAFGDPEELIRVNCAYDDPEFLYVSPETKKSFEFLGKQG